MASKLKCSKCGRTNPPQSRFCNSCGGSLAPPVPVDGLLQDGTVLRNTYVINGVLGEGGMGVVYEARHQTLGSRHAVKVLDSKLARVLTLRKRFLEEARIQATINHPNIVQVHDIIDEAGVLAMVMEYIEGRTLDALIHDERGQLSLGEAREITLTMLEAVGHAHAKGVIHRDLKPSNVMLMQGHDPHAVGASLKIMDFGIAKVLDANDGRTVTGAKMGTPRYMAPEQVKNARRVDGRADVYALGLTLFEMLSGKSPYEGLRDYDLLRAQVEESPPPLTELRDDVDEAMQRVLDRALEKNAQRRFESTKAFAMALGALGTLSFESPVSKSGGWRKIPTAMVEEGAEESSEGQDPSASDSSPERSALDDSDASLEGWELGDTNVVHSEVSEVSELEEPRGSVWVWVVGVLFILAVAGVGYRLLSDGAAPQERPRPLTQDEVEGGEQRDDPNLGPSPSTGGEVRTLSSKKGTMIYFPAEHVHIGRAANDRLARGTERPGKEIALAPFFLDQSEVAVYLYAQCVEEGGCSPLGAQTDDRPNLPVRGVGFASAQAYCEWAGKRLPTEDEWEAAARELSSRIYPLPGEPTCSSANYGTEESTECRDLNPGVPESVYSREHAKSTYHLRHMAGNVSEWVDGVAESPQARWVKGGSWRQGREALRVSARRSVNANQGALDVGFRCAKDAPSE